MSSTNLPAGRLQKAVPAPPIGSTGSRQSFEERNSQKPLRKPLPNSAPRTLPPAVAADHGIFLPPPPLGGAEPSKRHSSYDWTPNRPRTSQSSQGSIASFAGGRPMTPDGSLKPFNRLRPSASATNLAPPRSQLTQPPQPMLQKEPKEEKKKKGGWFSGRKDKKEDLRSPGAWIVAPGHTGRIPFDVDSFMAGKPVVEMWDERGDCFIHLFPQSSGKGPSFRIDSSVFASSARLTKKAFGKLYSNSTAVETQSTPTLMSRGRDVSGKYSISSDGTQSPRASLDDKPSEVHLHLDMGLNGKPAPAPPKKSLQTPISEDAETLIGARNLFAFLCGQSLVATERRFTLFSIFMRIADLLQHYEFSNMDGSSFGENAVTSFDSYVAELGLADVRKSAQKTVEMIVLGERMRSVTLYNEAFTHAAGKHAEIQKLSTGAFKMVSPTTQTRLSRAAMDLAKRIQNVELILTDFDFPSIFSGIMNSKTSEERRLVNFDAWRGSFFKMRGFFMGYYKGLFGSWPPKPNPKKNTLQTAGLNRVVLRTLYHDLGAMYDLLVDRTNLTSRTADGVLIEERANDPPRARALRHILSEYDRSSPPVKPPIPFDLPNLPDLRASRPELGRDKKADAKLLNKGLKSEEVIKVLQTSYNPYATLPPFIQAFRDFERSQAKGNNIDTICDLRYGQWIFMYAVLQSLPLLVLDAPGITYSDGVEYFLCEASRGGVPWARSGAEAGRASTWYGIAGGGGVVSLPSDVIENSVEGVYRRSHCWRMAERWSRDDPLLNAAVHEQQAATSSSSAPMMPGQGMPMGMGNLPPPPDMSDMPAFRNGSVASRNSSIGSETLELPPTIPAAGGLRVDSRSSSPARSKRESVLNLGLEALPLPRGVHPDGDYMSAGSGGAPGTPGSLSRPVSVHATDPSKTFDAILADVGGKKGKKKKA